MATDYAPLRKRDKRWVRGAAIITGIALALLAGGAVVVYFVAVHLVEQSKIDLARKDIKTLDTAANAFSVTPVGTSRYPDTLRELAEFMPDGGKPFVQPQALIDPWGKPYQYAVEQDDDGILKPHIWSDGPPGKNVKISNW